MSGVRQITVLGAGTMGHGIAHAAAASGFETRLFDVNEAALAKARDQIAGVFKKSVELGKASAADADAALRRLATTSDIAEALADTEFVIEAAPERIDLKLRLMADIDRLAPKSAV